MEEEEVLKEVRALLISAPHGLTSKELHRDFLAFVGTHLPYKALGFSTIDAYLHSKPRSFRRTCEGGQTIYRAVADASTQHIANMVSKQRTKKPKSRLSFNSRGSATKPGYGGRDNNTFGTPYVPEASTHSSRSQHQVNKTVPRVPYELQRRVAAVLQRYPNGVHTDDFPLLYKSMYNSQLSVGHVGFQSLHQLLRAIPEVVRLVQSKSSGGYVIYQSLVKGQSSAARSEADHVQAAFSASKERAAVGEDLKQEIKELVSTRPNGMWAGRLPLEYEARFNRSFPSKTLGYNSVSEVLSTMPEVCSLTRPIATGDFLILPAAQDSHNVDRAKEGKVFTPAPCSASSTDLSDMPALVSTSPPSSPPRSPVNTRTKGVSSSERLIDSTTRQRLMQLVQAHMPHGLRLNSLAETFKERYGQGLDLQCLGFLNVEQLISIMTSSLSMEYGHQGYVIKVKNDVMPSPVATQAEASNTYAAHPIGANQHTRHSAVHRTSTTSPQSNSNQSHTPVPLPGARFTESRRRQLGQFVLLQPPPAGSRCQVVLTDIVSAAEFSIQLMGERTLGELETLSNRMNSLYEGRHGSDYSLYAPEIGSACAAMFDDGSWYRCTVLHQHPDGHFQVHYVDYGNSAKVAPSALRSLCQDMLRLPAQAILSSLYNAPADSQENPKLSELLDSLTGLYRPITAVFHSNRGCVVDVTLYKQDGMCINAELSKFSSPGGHPAHGSSATDRQIPPSPLVASSTPLLSSHDNGNDSLPNLEPCDPYSSSSSGFHGDHSLGGSDVIATGLSASHLGDMASFIDSDTASPPPLEPYDDDIHDEVPVNTEGGYASDAESVAYESALDDSVDVLEEKIESLATLLESLERTRVELCSADVASSSADDSFDRVMKMTRFRMERLKHLSRERQQAHGHGTDIIPRSHQPSPRRYKQ